MGHAGDAVDCYIAEIPPFIEGELAKLYETLHSSLPFFKAFRSIEQANCYVARREGHPNTVLLFTCRGRQVEVLNEMIEIDQAEVARFTRYIFTAFPHADIISFKAVKTDVAGLAYPVQKHKSKDTYVVTLPATAEAYTASLGKSTRTGIRYQTNNILRHYPSFTSTFFTHENVDEKQVRRIIEFSERKINAKGLKFSYDVERIIALVRMCGFVNVLLVDGRVCAGTINYRIGSSFFGEVTGYDPAFEKYGLGKLCLHYTICESIARGGSRFYLGGGVFDFKNRMLGNLLSMDELHIYRSYSRVLVHADRAVAALLAAMIRHAKDTMHRHKHARLAQLVFRTFYFLRSRVKKWP